MNRYRTEILVAIDTHASNRADVTRRAARIANAMAGNGAEVRKPSVRAAAGGGAWAVTITFAVDGDIRDARRVVDAAGRTEPSTATSKVRAI